MTATENKTATDAVAVRAFLLNPADNIVTMLTPGKRGDRCRVSGGARASLVLAEDVPYGHKAATIDIAQGELIIKYGQVIGRAIKPIAAGSCVHVHNIESLRGRGDAGGES